MAYQTLGGSPIEPYAPRWLTVAPTFTSSTAITATGDKIAMIGRYWNPARATKSVQRVCFEWASITKAGGSALTLSLQDVDLANGPTMRPDGTQDQTVAVANADANLASNTWYRSGTLSADRSMTHGQWIAVVCEYDGSGRLGADSIAIRGMTVATSAAHASLAVQTSSTWAPVSNVVPNVVFEHSDGTFGYLADCRPVKAINTHSYKQDTGTADEFAMAFQVPAKCKLDSAWVGVNVIANTSDFNVILYSGTSALETVTVDANALRTTANTPSYLHVPFSQLIECVTGTQYYLAFQPTQTTSNISVYSWDVDDANHLGGHPGGPLFSYATRLDTGSWASITTTRRLLAGIGVAAWDDGAGIGGGSGLPGNFFVGGNVNF